MISGVFLLNLKGEILIHRDFRGDAPRKVADFFRHQVIFSTAPTQPPIKIVGHTTFFHLKENDVYVMASSRNNVNATEVFEVLLRIIEVFKSYFGTLDEESVRTNFVLIYELLDEIMDFGYPQNMDTETLKMYITQEGLSAAKGPTEDQKKITIQATGATTWRKEGIKYRRNMVYCDVVESVSMMVSSRGTVLHAEATGKILIKSQLSGMPECKFGLNDRLLMEKEKRGTLKKRSGNAVDIEDLKFHQCVRLGRFDADRTISFVPPDGTFELMRYRTSEHIMMPFKLLPIITMHGKTRMEVKLVVKSLLEPQFYGSSVKITIPVPKNTATTTLVTSFGNAKYVGSENAVLWTINQFTGGTEHSLSGEVQLLHTVSDKVIEHAPISMSFEVPGKTASGLAVRFLQVYEKSSYQTIKWVRYITKAGTYQHRV